MVSAEVVERQLRCNEDMMCRVEDVFDILQELAVELQGIGESLAYAKYEMREERL